MKKPDKQSPEVVAKENWQKIWSLGGALQYPLEFCCSLTNTTGLSFWLFSYKKRCLLKLKPSDVNPDVFFLNFDIWILQ